MVGLVAEGELEYRMKGSGWNRGSETCSLGVTGEDSGGKQTKQKWSNYIYRWLRERAAGARPVWMR